MAFAANDLARWLIGLLANGGSDRLTTVILGTDQEEALRSAASAAVRETARDLGQDDDEQAEQAAMEISLVFRHPIPDAPLTDHRTLLGALQAGIALQLSVLDDARLAGTGQSSAVGPGVPGAELAANLTAHILREIAIRGSREGPLFPLASHLNDDISRLLSNEAAPAEIASAQCLLLDQPLPNLEVLAILAVESDRLERRNHAVPDNLPALWARLGRVRHAVALARSIPRAAKRATALARIAETELGKSDGLARALVSAAEGAARQMNRASECPEAIVRVHALRKGLGWAEWLGVGPIADWQRQLLAIRTRMEAFEAGSFDRFDPIVSASDRALALAARAEILLALRLQGAPAIADRARDAALAIAHVPTRLRVLITMAAGLAGLDPSRAQELAGLAVQAAKGIGDIPESDERYYDVVKSLTEAGLREPALEIIRLIPEQRINEQAICFYRLAECVVDFDPDWATDLTLEAVGALNPAGTAKRDLEDPGLAGKVRSQAAMWDTTERAALTIPDLELQAAALSGMAAVIFRPGSARRQRLAGLAAATAAAKGNMATRPNSETEIRALTALATVLACLDGAESETATPSSRHWHYLPSGLTLSLVKALAASREWESAEAAARTIASPQVRVQAFAHLAGQLHTSNAEQAAIYAQRADRIAGDAHVPWVARIIEPGPSTINKVVEHAVSMAKDIGPPEARSVVFAAMAVTVAPWEPEQAGRMMQWTASSVASVRATSRYELVAKVSQSVVLAFVGAVLAPVDESRAGEHFEKARELAMGITDLAVKALTLAFLASILTQADPALGTELGRHAEHVARTIENKPLMADTCMSVATVLHDALCIDVAALAEEAIRSAKAIDSPEIRAVTLTNIADIRADQDPELSRQLTNLAEYTARLCPEPGFGWQPT